FYVLNKNTPVQTLMNSLLDKHPEIKLLIKNSIEKTECLQAMISLAPNMFRDNATCQKIREYTKEASVQTIDKDKNSLLGQACFLGSLDIVSYLIDHDANIEYRNNKGETPLAQICSSSYRENAIAIATILLDNGA